VILNQVFIISPIELPCSYDFGSIDIRIDQWNSHVESQEWIGVMRVGVRKHARSCFLLESGTGNCDNSSVDAIDVKDKRGRGEFASFNQLGPA
jgi:hypothetical protein